MVNNEEFVALGLSAEMLSAVEAKGFERPTPVQKLTIPRLLSQTNDIIAQSQTGTGKTAAYGLPILQSLERNAGAIQAIILVPTRELALQVTEELISYNSQRKLSIAAIYGGASISEQLRRLSKGVDIVVGTPGRVCDHIRRGTLKLSGIRFLILDEADEMLNMGFIEDVEDIMSHTPEQRRVLMFSATMPKRIIDLSKRYMRGTEILKVEATQLTTALTDQIYFEVRESEKFDALTRIIDITQEFYGIVFSRTKVGVDDMVSRLLERGYAAEGLHGDVSQAQREKTLGRFKKKHVNILVATDVAARGIDINNLSHVINYSLPQDSESYVHRIGRTGRAGNQGTAITFISSSEMRQFGFLKRDIKVDIQKKDLPSAQDVVAVKRNRIKDELQEIVNSEKFANYGDMAEEILAMYSPEVALSALLQLAFQSELDQSNYPEIRSFSVDRKGTTRLFLAIGKRDGYDVRKLVTLLKRECGLHDKHIDDVKLSENFSFVSVPFSDAEQIVQKLNKLRRGDKPLAEIAQGDDARGGRSERPATDRKPRAKREDKNSGGFNPNADLAGSPSRQDDDYSASRKSSTTDRPTRSRKADGYAPSFDKPARGRKTEDSNKSDRTSSTRTRKTDIADSPKRSYVKKTVEHKADKGESFTPSASDAEGFDWSMFEKDGNSWGDKPAKGKKNK